MPDMEMFFKRFGPLCIRLSSAFWTLALSKLMKVDDVVLSPAGLGTAVAEEKGGSALAALFSTPTWLERFSSAGVLDLSPGMPDGPRPAWERMLFRLGLIRDWPGLGGGRLTLGMPEFKPCEPPTGDGAPWFIMLMIRF